MIKDRNVKTKGPIFDKPHGEETKKKISLSKIGKNLGSHNAMYGRKRPEMSVKLIILCQMLVSDTLRLLMKIFLNHGLYLIYVHCG